MKKTFYFCNALEKNGRIAQLVQSICLTSRGSAVRIRLRPQKYSASLKHPLIGRIAQLVQSICLTSRGSAVRIRLRPHRLNKIESNSGRIAQLVQSICLTSRGSAVRIRLRPPRNNKTTITFGRIAQLVQSICLTSRGSAVRIRLRPPQEKDVSKETSFFICNIRLTQFSGTFLLFEKCLMNIVRQKWRVFSNEFSLFICGRANSCLINR